MLEQFVGRFKAQPRFEISNVVKSETHPARGEFSKGAVEFLTKRGIIILTFNGQSLRDQEFLGLTLWEVPEAKPRIDLSRYRSMQSQVAFDPTNFVLPKSNKCSWKEQQEMIDEFSYDLQSDRGSKDIKAVRGNVADHSLLTLLYQKEANTKMRNSHPLGPELKGDYVWTSTPTRGNNYVAVGNNGPLGLHIGDYPATLVENTGRIYAAPLIIPAGID